MLHCKKILLCLLLLSSNSVIYAQFVSINKDWQTYVLSQDFHWQVDSSFQEGVALVESISFHNPNGLKIKGLLIRPIGGKSYPLVIYQAGNESSKTQFLNEMLTLAQNQIMGIILDAPNFAEVINPHFNKQEVTYIYREAIINIQLIINYLTQKYSIKNNSIAMVGHSFGANIGVILAGTGNSVKYLISIACPPNIVDMYRQTNEINIQKINEATPKERFDIWLSMLAPYNAELYCKKIKTQTFFQFANFDEYISVESAQSFYDSSPQPKEIKFYDCKHAMNLDAEQDRISWLLNNLKK